MNAYILLGSMSDQVPSPGFGEVVQQYWYAAFVLPVFYFVIKAVRGKRRHKVYRW